MTPTWDRATHSGQDWQTDFLGMPWTQGNVRRLLDVTDTLASWIEACPTQTDTALEFSKTLLKEITPRFGLPKSIQSHNRPAIVSQISTELFSTLGIKWAFHATWRPQLSGKVKQIKPSKATQPNNVQTHTCPGSPSPRALVRTWTAPKEHAGGVHVGACDGCPFL